ncbi:MAG: N-formylglutamate amidohydrolase [Alphaproteobacteria bacterium]
MQLKNDDMLQALADQPLTVLEPQEQLLPLVMSSPHSGAVYPESFVDQSSLDPQSLRRSEDCFMDQVASAAAGLGVPVVAARFPRVFLDVNREPYELDPAMFDGPAPSHVRSGSARVKGGLGTIARTVGSGQSIYRDKLSYEEAEWRIEHFYRPYHATLQRLLEATAEKFGFAILIDWHSMPSAAVRRAAGMTGRSILPDLVLGDRFGRSCGRAVVRGVEDAVLAHKFQSARNAPYAGGHITAHYGRPQSGVHALQIEVNRALYMDEALYEPSAGLDRLVRLARQVAENLGALELRPARDTRPPLAAE